MKLLQLTDIHLTKPGQTIGGRDPSANFQKALDHAMQNHKDAEAIFITGDLSDWGKAEDYDLLKRHLADLEMPVHLLIGNHDDRATLLEAFPDLADENGFVQQAIPLTLGTAVTLDTWGPETHAGHFCETRADWLSSQLSNSDGPFWLFMHHNPIPIHVGPMDKIMLLDHERFKETIRPYRHKIRHIFHGHCHLPLAGSLMGIPLSAIRSTNHQGWPDFAATKMLSGADMHETYGVIFADEENTLIHMVEYGYAGDIRGEGSPDYADWDELTMVR